MKAILIDGPSRRIYELEIKPSHWCVEEEIGTRFWVVRRLGVGFDGDVLFHSEGRNVGYEDFTFGGVGYSGSGLVCHIDEYGDLDSARLTLEQIAEITTWPEKPPRETWFPS
jgi:hypothetical protein